MRDVHDTHDNQVRLITADRPRTGKLEAIIITHQGHDIALEPMQMVQLALNAVEIHMKHDQTDHDKTRDNDVNAIPEDNEDLMVNAFPWYPSMAQRARALDLVDVRYHGGDWQTAFITFHGNAVREQDRPQMCWALAEFASETLQSHGWEEGRKLIEYALSAARQAAIEEKENRDDE